MESGWSVPSANPTRFTGKREGFTMDKQYETPEILELGTVQELTLQDKDFSGDDGFTFMGTIIGNAS